MKKKIGIVIQGPSGYFYEHERVWKHLFDKKETENENKNEYEIIFSCWKGSEPDFPSSPFFSCENKEDKEEQDKEKKFYFTLLFSDVPGPYHQNFKHHLLSSFNGLQKAKELGCTHALKIRSDLVPTNAQEFVKMIDNDGLNVLAYHGSDTKGYFTDYLMSGPIDLLLNLWGMPENDYSHLEYEPAEVKINTKLYSLLYGDDAKKNNEDIKIHVFLKNLSRKEDCPENPVENDLFWMKWGFCLSCYQPERNSDHRGYVSHPDFFKSVYGPKKNELNKI